MKKCIICNKELNGRQKKVCSSNCGLTYKKQLDKKYKEAGLDEELKLTTGRYSQLKGRLKQKGFTYLMSKDKYMEMIKEPCYYCGAITYGVEKGVGLDRLDCSGEYTEDNVVPCCGPCNRSKSNVHNPEQFKKMMQVDKYIEILEKLNKAQKVERTLDEFISYLDRKY